ncbi:hypothetical protein Pyn_26629 [Prunus yedoensis var. nudiflora]|uniref:Uncharacterized protein n=1 Tax=Prunus yedoensis var. nudiflora TaxID=2094558 RepID=A0A314UEV5_PRUYE|nr:hypothetical protein Pyn_26629 [Prunus yedoensis var. nudiflora]
MAHAQVYNPHPSFDLSKERFLAMMISIIINQVKNLSKAWLRSNNSIDVFSPPPTGKIIFHDDFNHHISSRQLRICFQMQGCLKSWRVEEVMVVNPPWNQNQEGKLVITSLCMKPLYEASKTKGILTAIKIALL